MEGVGVLELSLVAVPSNPNAVVIPYPLDRQRPPTGL